MMEPNSIVDRIKLEDIPQENYDPVLYCRTCASENTSFVPIFKDEGLQHDLEVKIGKYLPIRICKDDKLPLQLCHACTATLLTWDALVVGCVAAEQRLLALKTRSEEEGDSEIGLGSGLDSDDEPLITKQRHTQKKVGKRKTAAGVKCKDGVTTQTNRLNLSQGQEQDNEEEERGAGDREKDGKWRGVKGAKKDEEECVVCGRKVRFLKRHMRVHDKDKMHLASPQHDNNHAYYDTDMKPDVLAARYQTSDPPDMLECDVCGRKVRKKYQMRRHLKTHSQEKRFTCHYCGKQYSHESGLQRHMLAIHEGIRRYKCPICAHVLPSNEELRVHQDSHTDPRPFQCDECGKTFTCRKHLYHHGKYHHTANGLRELCQLCNRYFSSASVLKRHHKVIHLGLKEFQCHVCSAQLTTKQYLQEHLRIHTDERPEVCGVCGKTFQMAGNLRQHMKTHMERTQICDVCGKGFTRRCHLVVHMGSHRGVELPQCAVCGRGFMLKVDLMKHVKAEHESKLEL